MQLKKGSSLSNHTAPLLVAYAEVIGLYHGTKEFNERTLTFKDKITVELQLANIKTLMCNNACDINNCCNKLVYFTKLSTLTIVIYDCKIFTVQAARMMRTCNKKDF